HIEAVCWIEPDLVYRNVIRAPAFSRECAGPVNVAIRWPVKVGGIALQRVSGELFDVNSYRCGEPLRSQDVVAGRRAVRAGVLRQPERAATRVARHQGRAVLDSGGGPGEDGDAWPNGAH